MLKRIFIFFAVSLLVSITISTLMSVLGIGNYISAAGLNYGSLMAFCLLWGMGGSFITLLISKPLAKWTMGVEIIEENSHRNLVLRVHHFAKLADLPSMPEVGVYESDELNAFATGRSKSSSLVAVSTGLLKRMDDEELDGVLAHEVAHIANGDMVTMTLVQGVINAFVMFFSRIIAFAISNALRKDDDEAPTSPWVHSLIVIFLDIIFGLMAMPIVAWFSRYREYRADRGGAKLAGNNKMIAALESLQRAYPQMAMSQSVTNHNLQALQISSKNAWIKYFSTHPPLEDRIAALKKPH
jgi:heat shock protein HtpX